MRPFTKKMAMNYPLIRLVDRSGISYPDVPSPKPALSFALVIESKQGDNFLDHPPAEQLGGIRPPEVNAAAIHVFQ